MRLRVVPYLLLICLISIAASTYAAQVTSYRVGEDARLDLTNFGGLIVDKGGNIWFAAIYDPGIIWPPDVSKPALCRLDPKNGRVITYILPSAIGEPGALAYDAPRNVIWIADSESHTLSKFQTINRRVTVYYIPVLPGDMADFQSIAVDGYGRVFCALKDSSAIAVFDPATPTILTSYDVPTPYSLAVDSTGESVWFTSGPSSGGWIYSLLEPSVPQWTQWSTAGTNVNTICLKWDAVEEMLYLTASGANAIGVAAPTVSPLVLKRYDVCTAGSGVYGVAIEGSTGVAWVTQPLNGGVARIDTEAAVGTDVPIVLSSAALIIATTEPVDRPWVYQLPPHRGIAPASKWHIGPSDECPADEVEEFMWSASSMPSAAAVKKVAGGYETWVADIFDDAIVKIVR